MHALLVVLASVIAVAAAVRSTWSPCGLSMLSTITPMGERARRYSYRGTVAWFIAGAVLGGATLGAAVAGLAAVVATIGLDPEVAVAVAGVLALVTAASDAQVAGFRLPGHRRQVNEVWLDRYRSWVYGGGFGWQIGVGLATFIVTASVYLLVAVAALTAAPIVAFAIVTGFGVIRGLAVLASRGATTPARLQDLHRRFDTLSRPSRVATVGVQLAVATVAAAAVIGPAGVALVVVPVAGIAAANRPRPQLRSA